MQSSSNLFPVRLISAEVHGKFFEDIYLLKPNNSTDKSVEIAVTRYSASEKTSNKRPLVLLHGFFSNRLEWLPFPEAGLAHFFAEKGFEVWMPELRGHGFSPINKEYAVNNFSEYAQFDIPAINDFIIEKTGKRPVWIGNQFGGLVLSAALALQALPAKHIAGFVLLGAQVGHIHSVINLPLTARVGAWFLNRQSVIEGYKNGYGQENEPSRLVAEVVKWQTKKGWKSKNGTNYYKLLKTISPPLLAIAPSDVPAGKLDGYEIFFNAIGSKNKEIERIEGSKSHKKHPLSMLADPTLSNAIAGKILKWLESNGCSESAEGSMVA